MSSIYFRRWTRMYIQPASKYFHRYGVLVPGYEQFLYTQNTQDPYPENKRQIKKMNSNKKQEQLNEKLMNKLFSKYPDLKYESVNRQKYSGDNFNSYSYAYAFISQQKKLMKSGYEAKKAFEIVQNKFKEKMKRKMDQTLLSRGLAIGNRARSFLTIYQQQVQYQSRLKMLRTQRQVIKYQQKLDQIKNAVQGSDIIEEQSLNYERNFNKITNETSQQINQEFKDQKRKDLIQRLDKNFSNTFQQFYERAAYRDRLNGLTDTEIKEQIMISPQKIKNQTRQLIKFLQKKGTISLSPKGELRVSDTFSDRMKSFIFSSPTIKIAIMNELLSYQSPRDPINRPQNKNYFYISKLNKIKEISQKSELSNEEKKILLEKKIKEYEIAVNSTIPSDQRCYRIFESAEERMLRLQIKYYRSLINTNKDEPETLQHLKNVINKFRRLKFRMEKRYSRQTQDELAFSQHYQLGNWGEIQKDAQYEELLDYLRKKTQQRRLKAIDQVDDDKINLMIKDKGIPQIPESEGDSKRT